jgi:MFS family permease
MTKGSLAEDLHHKLVEEEDARACKSIDEKACKEVPGNFLLTIIANFFSKLGDAVSNPKIVLPWIMQTIGAPLYLLGFLVPIRESGSMIPQLVIAGYIRKMEIRKWVWVAGSVLQALSMAGMGFVAWTMEGAAGGWAIIGLLIVFSLARGLSSVASKDVLGKTIPKTERGKVTGWSASAAGLITLGYGAVLIFTPKDSFTPAIYGAMLAAAGVFWIIGGLVFARIKEFPGETDGGKSGFIEGLKRISILKTDKPFRRFVFIRALLLCSALTAPYYVALAQDSLGSPAYLLGMFVLADGAASLLSAPFWGRFADASSRNVMIFSAVIVTLLGVAVFAIDLINAEWFKNIWLLPAVYFVLSIAHQGVRIGRKTYVVNLAEGNKRTDYVSVSNTMIGIILLIMGLSGTLSSVLSIPEIILALSCLGATGALLGRTLPDVEKEN